MRTPVHVLSATYRFPRRTFLRRGLWTAVTAGALCRRSGLVTAASNPPQSGKWLDAASHTFLRELAAATLESARIPPGASRGGMGPNRTGLTIISPGGNYPALWTRDFAMSLDCGLVPPAEIRAHLWLIAGCQNGPQERRLQSGAIIPPFAIVDHINLAGGAVFYPGTYSAGEDQGAPPWGPLPPIDDHFYFIHIAYALWRDTREAGFLDETINDLRLMDRLERAFHAPASDPVTGAATTTRERRAVGFGFQDSVQLVGAMSFATPSPLSRRAAVGRALSRRRAGRCRGGVREDGGHDRGPSGARVWGPRETGRLVAGGHRGGATAGCLGDPVRLAPWGLARRGRRSGAGRPWWQPCGRPTTPSSTKVRYGTCRRIATSVRTNAGKPGERERTPTRAGRSGTRPRAG
ncbi:MAG: hypothetical protein M5U12_09155 [Verrucomicrobia bacterium]|nr:hypothetical protein [Verrucomicrobiota bacterium]